MDLVITIDERSKTLDVPQHIMDEGDPFFDKMDRDMDKGWQMGQQFIECPTPLNRCQIAADKILVAIDTGNENLLYLMAGYILKRMPDVTRIIIDTHGEMMNTELIKQGNQSIH